jgi:hypothetical protein
MKRTTEWTCDICGQLEIVSSNKNNPGLDLPYTWNNVYIRIENPTDEDTYTQRSMIMCGECIDKFKSLSIWNPKPRTVLSKTFWQKLFGETK